MTGEKVRLAVLGDPLTFTRSPELHRAGLEALGIECESRAIRTSVEALGARLQDLAADGYRGVNLTSPLKEAALPHLATIGEPARRARSVNTVGFDRSGSWGQTTDGRGFLLLLVSLGRPAARQRVVLLGAGGSARSLALALVEAGCVDLTVCARRPPLPGDSWDGVSGIRFVGWDAPERDRALADATLVVHCTPLADPGGPVPLDAVGKDASIIDLRYEERVTPWIARARDAGFEAWDGLGLLLHQARCSLELWTGCEVPIEPMARAVGWPR